MAEEFGTGTIIDTLTRGGAIGVMAVAIWAFLTGKVVAKKSHDEAIDNQKEIAALVATNMGEAICAKIEDGVAKGMSQGIADGYLKINGNKDDT